MSISDRNRCFSLTRTGTSQDLSVLSSLQTQDPPLFLSMKPKDSVKIQKQKSCPWWKTRDKVMSSGPRAQFPRLGRGPKGNVQESPAGVRETPWHRPDNVLTGSEQQTRN